MRRRRPRGGLQERVPPREKNGVRRPFGPRPLASSVSLPPEERKINEPRRPPPHPLEKINTLPSPVRAAACGARGSRLAIAPACRNLPPCMAPHSAARRRGGCPVASFFPSLRRPEGCCPALSRPPTTPRRRLFSLQHAGTSSTHARASPDHRPALCYSVFHGPPPTRGANGRCAGDVLQTTARQ